MNADEARDERLAGLLERMLAERRQGAEPTIEQIAAEAPELHEELRSLWTAVIVADCVALDRSRPTLGRNSTVGPHDPATPALPCQFGDYELLEELGRGGMGVVYRARHVPLDRIVALKMLRDGTCASSSDVTRFAAEAQATARLEHPHIVKMFAAGEHAGRAFFTMQYVAGQPLSALLADGPIDPRLAAEIMVHVCRAVHSAHEQGILHRDLKPSNVLLDEAGRPLVSDFGLAKHVQHDPQLTVSGAVLGTPTHMSPEQAAGARTKLTPASDVYSLGTILYQMLTGRPPFQAASPLDTVLLVLEQEPLPPRLVNPRANVELEMIALKCLQKPPELRYPTAAALADDLDAFLHDEPLAARAGRFSQIIARWFRETHQAVVLENWGLLWMWHSLALLLICLATSALQWWHVESHWPYLALWSVALGAWAAVFWSLRRRAGPVTFVERQIAHLWAGSMVSIVLLYFVEMILGLSVLSLSPVLGLTSGAVFLTKAGMLSGEFYINAATLFITALAMAWLQRLNIPLGIVLFGVVSAACFFVPGWKYHRAVQRR